jgi:hypothetical protein
MYKVKPSMRSGKRYVIDMGNGMLHHFGSDVGKTYVDGRTEQEKANWIARHRKDKNWNNIHSGIYWSRHLLWGPTRSLSQNLKIKN